MTKLIIDTDVALGVWAQGRPRDIDDGFAIVEAINSSSIELLGITCVFGNGPLDEVYRVATEIVELKTATVPVLMGAQEPMAVDGIVTPAVEFLAEQLRKQPLTIAAIGPLTNIALLVEHYPEVLHNIESLIMVAGRSKGAKFYIGDTGPVQDFNFESDIEAAQKVMSANIPCVLMGFELTSQVCITKSDLQTIKAKGNPTAQYFYDNSAAWCDHWTKTFPVDEGFHPWDSATIAWLLNAGWFVHEQRGARIDAHNKKFECDPNFSGPKHTYCTGFTQGGAKAFVEKVVSEVY